MSFGVSRPRPASDSGGLTFTAVLLAKPQINWAPVAVIAVPSLISLLAAADASSAVTVSLIDLASDSHPQLPLRADRLGVFRSSPPRTCPRFSRLLLFIQVFHLEARSRPAQLSCSSSSADFCAKSVSTRSFYSWLGFRRVLAVARPARACRWSCSDRSGPRHRGKCRAAILLLNGIGRFYWCNGVLDCYLQ